MWYPNFNENVSRIRFEETVIIIILSIIIIINHFIQYRWRLNWIELKLKINQIDTGKTVCQMTGRCHSVRKRRRIKFNLNNISWGGSHKLNQIYEASLNLITFSINLLLLSHLLKYLLKYGTPLYLQRLLKTSHLIQTNFAREKWQFGIKKPDETGCKR